MATMSEFVVRLRQDPDSVWHELRRQAFGRSPSIAVAFGLVLYDPHPDRSRLLVSVAAPSRKVVIPRRFTQALEELEEIRLLWDGGAATVPIEEIVVRPWTDTHLLLELPPLGA